LAGKNDKAKDKAKDKAMDNLKNILNKLGSGRLFLTIVAGVVFAWCSLHKILEAQAISAIISMVFISYFQRSDRGNGNGPKPS